MLPSGRKASSQVAPMNQVRLSIRAASRRRRRLAYSTASPPFTSEMLLDLDKRGDLAARPVAVQQQHPDPCRLGAGDVLLGGVSHVQGLAGPAADQLQGGSEDRRIGLAGAGLGRGDRT